MALATIEQTDFAAGSVRSVPRHLIPEQGFYLGRNATLHDDGSVARRSGGGYKSGGVLATGGLRMIWDGYLIPGQRTLVASSSKFGCLAADDTTITDLGGAGLAFPGQPATIDGMVFLPGGTIWAGARSIGSYSTGTVTVTNGSKAVTGAGTTWGVNVLPGHLFRVAGSGRYYVVESVGGNTSLTLATEYEGTTLAGQTYVASVLGDAASHGAPVSQLYAAGLGRLVQAAGRIVSFSNGVNPATGFLRTHVWTTDTDYHEVPYGAEIVAIQFLRDQLLVFTTQGVWTITNLAFNIVDAAGNPQQRLQLLSPELVAWGSAGMAAMQNALIVPCQDDIMLIDGTSPPEPISRAATPLYRQYVALGYRPGGATVFRNHYFLPILDNAAAVIDHLVFRMDRPVQTRVGLIFPYTQWSGYAANVRAVARRSTSTAAPELLTANFNGRIGRNTTTLDLTGTGTDGDASVPEFEVETRSFLVAGTSRRLRLRYELEGPATIQAHISIGHTETAQPKWGTAVWGAFTWADPSFGEYTQMEGDAPPADGTKPYAFGHPPRLGRYVRYRLRCIDPATKLIIRGLEIEARPSRKVT